MKIAVIGSGISGLSAAWFLKNEHSVVLFEKQNRFGGHANTSTVNYNGNTIDVDTGFIVFNYKTYYHLQRLFLALDVKVKKSEMSFGVSNKEIEYSSVAPFVNWNFLSGRYLKMLWEIIKFNRIAKKEEINSEVTLDSYLNSYNFSQYFRRNYIYAMAGSIWSCTIDEAKSYPAKSFIDFFKHHGLLQVVNHPQWYCVDGGSKEYVKKITQMLNTKSVNVTKVEKTENGVKVCYDGGEEMFDKVIIATHANEAFEITGNKVLSGFRYSKNLAVLHKDSSLMPKNHKTWASWNYVSDSSRNLCLTYWMNNLQNIDKSLPLFVTLNPTKKINNNEVFYQTTYHHPIFDNNSQRIAKETANIQGTDGIYYVGSYFGYGFHEDGIASAYEVCKKLVKKMPW
jgi:predicted NAD/FAD-binding protein